MTNDQGDRGQDNDFRTPGFSSTGSRPDYRGGDLHAKGTQVVGNAKEAAGEVKSRVKDIAGDVAEKAEETKAIAGEKMHSVAEKIRDGGEAVSRKADELGDYLQEHDFKAMGRDITEVVHRYPLQAMLVGIGLGILLGRTSR